MFRLFFMCRSVFDYPKGFSFIGITGWMRFGPLGFWLGIQLIEEFCLVCGRAVYLENLLVLVFGWVLEGLWGFSWLFKGLFWINVWRRFSVSLVKGFGLVYDW